MAVLSLELMPVLEKEPEAPPVKTIVVRYGYMKLVGEFPSNLTTKVGCGSKLVVRTERGTEIAEMLTTTCGNGGCGKSNSRDQMLQYISNSGGADYPFTEDGRILRVATVTDLAEQAKLDENRPKHIQMARELVVQYKLPMKIVEVEYPLGGERVLFYFTSEHRIDFRQLVRDLAHNLHTRIELRQVGAHDDARLTADYEKCGQHCCCKQFLKVLTPVSMRSAKVQKATLDPAKISGRCGRLMCCLRYEDQTYEELRKKLPKRNTRVRTAQGEGWVVDGQILTQLVMVLFDDGKREATPMEQILAFDLPKPVMANGQTMQGPNDRMPGDMGGDMAGPPGRGPQNRPMPGRPAGGPNAGGHPRPAGGPGQAPRAGAPNPNQTRPPHGPPQNRGPAPQRGPGPNTRQNAGPGPNAPRPPMQMPPIGQQPPAKENAIPPAAKPQPQPARPRDDIDDLIADAMDDGPPRPKMESPLPPVVPPASPSDAPPVASVVLITGGLPVEMQPQITMEPSKKIEAAGTADDGPPGAIDPPAATEGDGLKA